MVKLFLISLPLTNIFTKNVKILYKLIQLILSYILLFCLFTFQLKADSTTNSVNPIQLKVVSPTRYKPFLIAGGLIGYGVARQAIPALHQLDKNQEICRQKISSTYTLTISSNIPMLALYALDITGLQTKHSIVECTQLHKNKDSPVSPVFIKGLR